MTEKELLKLIADEGLEKVLQKLDPDRIIDSGIAEAFYDLQESYNTFVSHLPELEQTDDLGFDDGWDSDWDEEDSEDEAWDLTE